MARDALLKAIEDDARAQGEAIVKEAFDAASVVIIDAEARSSSMIEERRAAFRAEIERKRASMLNSARVRARSIRLAACKTAIEKAFDEALLRFKEMPRPEYRELLGRFHDELLRAWDTALAGEPIALVNPQDLPLPGRAGTAVRPDDTVSLGVVFVSSDGRVRFENTVTSRMDRLRKTAVLKIYRTLFGR